MVVTPSQSALTSSASGSTAKPEQSWLRRHLWSVVGGATALVSGIGLGVGYSLSAQQQQQQMQVCGVVHHLQHSVLLCFRTINSVSFLISASFQKAFYPPPAGPIPAAPLSQQSLIAASPPPPPAAATAAPANPVSSAAAVDSAVLASSSTASAPVPSAQQSTTDIASSVATAKVNEGLSELRTELNQALRAQADDLKSILSPVQQAVGFAFSVLLISIFQFSFVSVLRLIKLEALQAQKRERDTELSAITQTLRILQQQQSTTTGAAAAVSDLKDVPNISSSSTASTSLSSSSTATTAAPAVAYPSQADLVNDRMCLCCFVGATFWCCSHLLAITSTRILFS